MEKTNYITPQVEILDFKFEGALCTSGGGLGAPGDYENGGDPFGVSIP